jgi:hypothetical protein
VLACCRYIELNPVRAAGAIRQAAAQGTACKQTNEFAVIQKRACPLVSIQAMGARVSMDSKGRWVDNVFVERLWRNVNYEDIYLHAYETLREVKAALASYFSF